MFEKFEQHVRNFIRDNYSDADFHIDLTKGGDRKSNDRKRMLWNGRYTALSMQLVLLINVVNAENKLYDHEENILVKKFSDFYPEMIERFRSEDLFFQRDPEGMFDIAGGIEYFANEERNIRNFKYFTISEIELFLKELYHKSEDDKSTVENFLRELYGDSHSNEISSLFSAGTINTISYLYTLNLFHHIFNAEEIPDHLMLFIDFAATRLMQASCMYILRYFRAGERKSKLLEKNVKSKQRMYKNDSMILAAFDKKKKDSWNESTLPRTTKRNSVAMELAINGISMGDSTLDRALKRLQKRGLISGY